MNTDPAGGGAMGQRVHGCVAGAQTEACEDGLGTHGPEGERAPGRDFSLPLSRGHQSAAYSKKTWSELNCEETMLRMSTMY